MATDKNRSSKTLERTNQMIQPIFKQLYEDKRHDELYEDKRHDDRSNRITYGSNCWYTFHWCNNRSNRPDNEKIICLLCRSGRA